MRYENTTLGELSIDGKGSYGIAASAVPYSEELLTYLRITDISDDGTIKKSGLMSVADENAGKYLLKPNDIVFARTGNSTGRNYFYDGSDGNFVYAGFLIKFSLNPRKVNPKYIKYYCQSSQYWNWVQSFNTGSTRGNINAQTFANMEIALPTREQQNFLVSVLSPLDEKIELNQRINDNLERQAQMLYKQWMHENEGNYTMAPLEEVAEINPDTYSAKEAWTYIHYLDTSNITKGTISEIQYIPATEKIPSRARRKVLPNDIVYSTVRPNQHHYGIVAYPLENMLVPTGFAVIRSKSPDICNELIYLTITENETVEKMQQIAEQSTSTFPAIKPSDLGSCLVPHPIGSSASKLSRQLNAIYSSIAANNEQNKFLTSVRDTLLPKLMSGEIDLQEV